eukprot:symbB.v1.2.034862.t2/scaffold4577.1/size37779/3
MQPSFRLQRWVAQTLSTPSFVATNQAWRQDRRDCQAAVGPVDLRQHPVNSGSIDAGCLHSLEYAMPVKLSGVLGHASAFSPKKLAQFFARALACRVRPVDCLVMGDDFDALDFDHDKDFESLPCDLNYAVVCLILPALNGLLNGFLWPAYTLYFQENGWPVVRAGLAQGLGFCFRVLTQQMQLAAGYWLIVPLAVIHLTFAVLGLIYFDQEWAVFAEILVVFTIDPTCAIEGLAFDTFGNSEVQARQAASTSLSVYTICVASACTIGGIAYDFFSWKGTATFHTICQSLLLFMLAIQPSMRQSFMEVWFPAKEPEKIEEDQEENSKRAPNTPNTDAASGAEVTKVAFAEKLEEDQEENSTRTLNTYAASGAEVANLTFSENFEEYQMESSTRTLNTYAASGAEVANLTFSENFEEYQVESSTRTPNKDAASGANGALWAVLPGVVQEDNPPADLVLESLEVGEDKADALKKHLSITSAGGRGSRTSRNRRNFVSGNSTATLGTSVTALTAKTVFTAMSRMTALSEAGQDFHHHFGTNLATMPHIVGRTGAKRVLRDEGEYFDEGDSCKEKTPAITETAGTKARSKIPKDIRLPVFLIVLNCFTNTATYVIEFSTFALFFKEVHSWNEATPASLAQTAGDVVAALMMQVIPFLMPGGYDPDEAGPCSRFWHSLTSQPYTITCVLVSWMVFNACLLSPWLPIAIVGQVFMGTSYVYSCKWSTDMSLFYSLGDSQVFLAIQVLCRNADALGGGLGSIFGTWLYTFGPTVPFIFGTGFTTTVFLLYTVSFCSRLGFGDDIETAEAKRSRRQGKRRVSSWRVDAPNRNSQMPEIDV